MKIIRRGEPPEQRSYEATCTRCKTVFQFEACEAKRVSDQRDGDYFEVMCPVCSHPVTKACT